MYNDIFMIYHILFCGLFLFVVCERGRLKKRDLGLFKTNDSVDDVTGTMTGFVCLLPSRLLYHSNSLSGLSRHPDGISKRSMNRT